MKKTITLFCVLAFIASHQISAQNDSVSADRPTYFELKQAGLLNNYSPEQLTEMQAKEARPMQSRIDEEKERSTRNIEPPPPTIETISNAFSITPVNPSVCSG